MLQLLGRKEDFFVSVPPHCNKCLMSIESSCADDNTGKTVTSGR